MLGKRKTKAELQAIREVNAKVTAFILFNGGKQIGEPRTFEQEEIGPEFSIQTIAGDLHVRSYGTWIACRFQDINAAKRILPFYPKNYNARLNGFSGKWNFVGENALDDLQSATGRLLVPEVKI